MLLGLHHAAMSTPDMDRALGFYEGLLGFEIALDLTWTKGSRDMDALVGFVDSSGRCVMLRAPNAFLELFQFDSPVPRAAGRAPGVCEHGLSHICLAVTGIDAEHARLTAAGVEFSSAPTTAFGMRAVHGRDPDGNVVELLEVLDPAASFALFDRAGALTRSGRA